MSKLKISNRLLQEFLFPFVHFVFFLDVCLSFLRTPMGHQRHRSDEDRSALAASVTSAQMATDEQQRLSFRLKWNPADRFSI